MAAKKNPKKEYRGYWMDEDGSTMNLDYKVTDNPKNMLFDLICTMVASTSRIFDTTGKDSFINKWIKESPTPGREHYFAEINGQVLGVMEVLPRKQPQTV